MGPELFPQGFCLLCDPRRSNCNSLLRVLPPLLTHVHVQFCYCAESLPEKLSEIQLAQKALDGLRLSEYEAKLSYVDVVAKEVKFEDNLPIMVQLPYRQPAVVRATLNMVLCSCTGGHTGPSASMRAIIASNLNASLYP